MPIQRTNLLAFGGVDDRSTPANYPAARAVRCRNWSPLANGNLRLRLGFTQPTMDAVSAINIHSATYYEQFNGAQFIVFGQDVNLRQLDMTSGHVTTIGFLSNINRWGQFRANQRVHISNGTDFNSWDGAVLRLNGIRPPSTSEIASITATFSTATAGSVSTTTLSGYDVYMSYYNPNTGHVGNRVKITSTKLKVTSAGTSLVLTGLPNLSLSLDNEALKVIGLTPDGGEVPYWLLDSSGNRVIVGNTATVATFTIDSRDFNAELPTRNTVGSGFDGFAKVGTRIFAKKPNDYFLYYSGAEEDAVSGIYIGRPEESWPGNNAEAFPPHEVITCVGSYNFEGWVFSRNYLMRWSETLRQQVTDPWIGPYQVGCAGQRAFIVTPYGPFWVTPDKEFFTWSSDGPIEAGNEYVRTLLAKVGDAYVSTIELVYFRDTRRSIDQVKMLAMDTDGNPFLIIHDFSLKDETSPFGQAYECEYTNMLPTTFVGSGYSPYVPVRDVTSKRLRCWVGDSQGHFNQLDDGSHDNGATYTGDYISGPIALGPTDKQIAEVELMGDPNIQLSYSTELDDDDTDFLPMSKEDWIPENSISNYKVTDHGRFLRFRLQLDSDLTGNFDVDGTYATPVNNYGILYQFTPKFGAERRESR